MHLCTDSLFPDPLKNLASRTATIFIFHMLFLCSFSLSSAFSSNLPLSPHIAVQSVALRSLQTIPNAAFPKYHVIQRCVPYHISHSADMCNFELPMHYSPFHDSESLMVVPPFTGYPRASINSSGFACVDEFDLCAQSFQVTFQVTSTNFLSPNFVSLFSQKLIFQHRQLTVALEIAGEDATCDVRGCRDRYNAAKTSLLSLLHMNIAYSDLTAAVPQMHFVSPIPRILSPPSGSFAKPASSAPPHLRMLEFSASITVPRCSILRTRVQIIQVICVAHMPCESSF